MRLVDHALGTGRIGHVAGDRDPADLFGNLIGSIRVEVGDRYTGTDGGQQLRRLAPDA